jgi:hypothetical protein
MALNALEIDPKTIWKGNWRWVSELHQTSLAANLTFLSPL